MDTQRPTPSTRVVLVALVVDTAARVLAEAAGLAAALDAELVAVHVDPSRHVTARHPDGTVDSTPIDPDADDELHPHTLSVLRRLVDGQAARGRPVTFRATAGDPAEEISRLAEHLNARVIVVGTRKPGLAHQVSKFFTGSVAAHLAHRQGRPVLVVPSRPGSFDDPAPWDGRSSPPGGPPG